MQVYAAITTANKVPGVKSSTNDIYNQHNQPEERYHWYGHKQIWPQSPKKSEGLVRR